MSWLQVLQDILEKEEFDKSMRIRLDGEAFRISHQIASNLYIKPNNAS